jgi:hypothetical protein
MAETHVISALRAKRAEVSGNIHDLEKKIKRMRANLAHIGISGLMRCNMIGAKRETASRRSIST